MKLSIAYSRQGWRRCTASRRLLAAILLGGLPSGTVPAIAQIGNPLMQQYETVGTATTVAPGEQMLLEADELAYDFDRETVTATGNVQINYRGFVVDAERLTYDQRSGRLVVSGGVRMLEPGGNLVTAESMDITDDFRDGFVESLNIVTIDRTRFSAQGAERRGGNLTIFRRGVYTACEPCAEHPDRPPLWQIKAARIIQDQSERMVYYEHARLEFFGVPIAYVPFFSHPDPTVKRKTGFITPSFLQTDAIGFGITTPYFWNLAPNYDLTFSPTFLTRQGLLMQTEWRHRLMNGSYTIRLAGVFQADGDAFQTGGVAYSGYNETLRGSARTTGSFAINERWAYGWDLHGASDRMFNRDYLIPDALAADLTSTAYLTGRSERNFFDMRGYHFLVQRENTQEIDAQGFVQLHDDQAEQAVVHPVVDHNYILDDPFFGGEVRFDSNFTSLSRDESDVRHPPAPFPEFYAGVSGQQTRASSRASWQRRFIVPGGQLLTPFGYMQADASYISPDEPNEWLGSPDLVPRAMPAGGLEYEWPILATLGSTVHTFGPRAQLILRPDEQRAGDLPNEDAQSLVFDDTNLFEWDKFSGYDRQEGGTRANLGLEYQGLFPGGMTVDALLGQSYQLAGLNSFAAEDHALTGLGSGLDDEASDYVGRVTVDSGLGLALTARGRFDQETLDVNRGEVNATGTYGGSVASLGYAYVRDSAASGVFEDREEINGATAIQVAENWSVLGSAAYDLNFQSPVSQSLGLAYADECVEVSAIYTETNDPYSDVVAGRQIFFRVNLRTVGGRTFSRNLDSTE